MDLKTALEPKFAPICPSCEAGGERQRRKRGGWGCMECGERYTTEAV